MFRAIILIASFLIVSTGCASISNAQFLNDEANMKILKVRAGLLQQNRANTADKVQSSLGDLSNISSRINCGSVDIGNTITTGGIGRDVSVIITGDIINTDNRCITK